LKKAPVQRREAVFLLVMQLPEAEVKTTPANILVAAGLSLVVGGGRSAYIFRVLSTFIPGWTSHWAPAGEECRCTLCDTGRVWLDEPGHFAGARAGGVCENSLWAECHRGAM